jgi:hypothetical protein
MKEDHTAQVEVLTAEGTTVLVTVTEVEIMEEEDMEEANLITPSLHTARDRHPIGAHWTPSTVPKSLRKSALATPTAALPLPPAR